MSNGYEGKTDRDLLIEMHTTLYALPPRLTAVEKTQDDHASAINQWQGSARTLAWIIGGIGAAVLAFGTMLLAHVLGGK